MNYAWTVSGNGQCAVKDASGNCTEANSQSFSVVAGAPGSYTVNCTISDNVGTTPNPCSYKIPVVGVQSVTVNNPAICPGGTSTITASPTSDSFPSCSPTWTVAYPPGVTCANCFVGADGSTTATVTPSATFSGTATITATCGSSSQQALVTVSGVGSLTASSSAICAGNTATLTASPSAGSFPSGSPTWTIAYPSGASCDNCFVGNDGTTTATFTPSEIFIGTATITAKCGDTSSKFAQVTISCPTWVETSVEMSTCSDYSYGAVFNNHFSPCTDNWVWHEQVTTPPLNKLCSPMAGFTTVNLPIPLVYGCFQDQIVEAGKADGVCHNDFTQIIYLGPNNDNASVCSFQNAFSIDISGNEPHWLVTTTYAGVPTQCTY